MNGMRRAVMANTVLAMVTGAVFGMGPAQAATTADSTPTQVLLGFKPGAAAEVQSAVTAAGGRIVADLSEVNGMAVRVPAAAVAQLQRNPNVEFVEDDAPRYAFARASRTSLTTAGQTLPYGIPLVQADKVSDSLASDRKLCIVDSGVDLTHEDLEGIAIDGDNLTTSGEWYTDEDGHGTHVAGTIAAVNNTIGVLGVLPNRQLRLHIAKVFDATGTAPTSTVIRGMISVHSSVGPAMSRTILVLVG